MRIVIVGAGTAGQNLAKTLCSEYHDVVVVDRQPQSLAGIAADLDILTVVGEGGSPAVLDQAEVEKADLLVAVTNRDEINIMACMYAREAGVKHTVARIVDPSYHSTPHLDLSAIGVDHALNPKEECAKEIFDVLHMPGSREVAQLLDGKINAVGVKLPANSPLSAGPLQTLSEEPWLKRTRCIGLQRDGELVIPHGDTTLLGDDEAYFVMKPEDAEPFLDWMHSGKQRTFDKVIIAGCGGMGISLASRIEDATWDTVVIESNRERAEACSATLDKALIINGNAADRSVLEGVGVTSNTAFVATTGDDELNILSCAQAKQLGAGLGVAQINRGEYVSIVDALGILDRVVSPHLAMIKPILRLVRGKNVQDVEVLSRIPGELLDVVISEKQGRSEPSLRNMKLPRGAIVAAVQRGEDGFVPTGDLTLQKDDRLIIFSLPESIGKLHSLFQK